MHETCLACGVEIKGPLYSLSHTIKRGAKLCPECGQRESSDLLWADGLRIGFERDALARKAAEGKVSDGAIPVD